MYKNEVRRKDDIWNIQNLCGNNDKSNVAKVVIEGKHA